ncbi:ABC-type branched-subunit amino acid transport system ATPase component [Agrobacterium sp. SORGH_AS440]|nr:ABC-type branched-subunit amino acid transport system ATPase component [Agrobacterium sp. SORGH_AS_0440]
MAAMLEVSNLKSWYGESQALHGVDLTVGEGETITILGRNGVGKTTTLRTIMGIIRKPQGRHQARRQGSYAGAAASYGEIRPRFRAGGARHLRDPEC